MVTSNCFPVSWSGFPSSQQSQGGHRYAPKLAGPMSSELQDSGSTLPFSPKGPKAHRQEGQRDTESSPAVRRFCVAFLSIIISFLLSSHPHLASWFSVPVVVGLRFEKQKEKENVHCCCTLGLCVPYLTAASQHPGPPTSPSLRLRPAPKPLADTGGSNPACGPPTELCV